MASAHRDPAKEPLLEEAARLYRPDPANLGTVIRALNTGQPVLIEDVTDPLLDGMGLKPRVRELFNILAPVSWMTIPLVARGKTLGTIVFFYAQPARRYSSEDLSVGQLFASRAALAIQKLAIVCHDLP